MSKKKLISMGLGAALIVTVFGILGYKNVSADTSISMEEAKNKVTNQYPGIVTEIEKDKKGSKTVYEMEILGKNQKYELVLDANSGKVLKLEEKEKLETEDQTPIVKISIDQGKAIAKKVFNGTVKEIEIEKEDDLLVYEVKMMSKNKKADIKIDANNGTVLQVKEKDLVKNEQEEQQKEKPTKHKDQSSSGKIGIEKAKQIAQKQFNGKVEEAELDNDDGRLIYEVEMVSNEKEAEIAIDAYTGEVLVVSVESADNDDN